MNVIDNTGEIKIRVYRAINNLDACIRFAEGHSNVLTSYNIKKVTSSDTSWFKDPAVHIIMIESKSGDKIYGGAKLHLKNKKNYIPLEEAVGKLDPKVYTLFDKYAPNKTGELCGLWNSRSVAGSGLSVLLVRVVIAKACIMMAGELELDSVYALAAPWTLQMVKDVGFEIENSVGNDGAFNYPKPDLLATVCVVNDIKTLKKAKRKERADIFDLREHPKQKRIENGPKGDIEVEYDLVFSNFAINKSPIKKEI